MQRTKHYLGTAVSALTVLVLFISTMPCYSNFYPYVTIPLFQYAIFYNLNLEVDPGHTFPVEGSVFCNAGIWSGTGNVTYSSSVEAVGKVSTNAFDPFCTGKSDSGTPGSSFQYPGQPVSGEIPTAFYGGMSFTNAEALINLPPTGVRAPLPAAYQNTNSIYCFNSASLIVSNWYYGTNGVAPWSNNFTVYLQDNLLQPFYVQSPNGNPVHWVELTNDFYIVSNSLAGAHFLYTTNYVPNFKFTNNVSGIRWTNNPAGTNTVWYAGFSFLTNASFYDFRESVQVQAVQLDVGKLGAWITNNTVNAGSNWNQELDEDIGRGINSIFIYNAVPFIGQQQLPAVRLVDGQLLPSSMPNIDGFPLYTVGLTVVTPQPLYVLGNYNVQINGGPVVLNSHDVTNTYPAALMADAITILSTDWVDTNANAVGESYITRMAANTTINAACLEGIVPSSGSSYSGGVENYFRLLEDWSGYTFTYNGSMTAMFSSIYATNLWGGSYYTIPYRDWAYNTNFSSWTDLPPLTWNVISSNDLPAIVDQPSNQIVLSGSNATFSVTVTNLPWATYQWRFNGTDIPAYSNTLVLTNVNATNTGNYTVLVTSFLGSLGSATSSVATLTVAFPPAISVQPTNETVLTGQTTNFTVTATGIPAVAYQWIFKGTNISWGTNVSLVLTNVQLTNAGSYAVQITNVFGALVSSNATLSVYTSAMPVMNTLSFSSASGLQFNVSGVPGFNYAVEASTNLLNWTPLTTNNSPFNFDDTNMDVPYRFYRSVYLP